MRTSELSLLGEGRVCAWFDALVSICRRCLFCLLQADSLLQLEAEKMHRVYGLVEFEDRDSARRLCCDSLMLFGSYINGRMYVQTGGPPPTPTRRR